jgi:hypothetical protein
LRNPTESMRTESMRWLRKCFLVTNEQRFLLALWERCRICRDWTYEGVRNYKTYVYMPYVMGYSLVDYNSVVLSIVVWIYYSAKSQRRLKHGSLLTKSDVREEAGRKQQYRTENLVLVFARGMVYRRNPKKYVLEAQ